MSSSFLQKLKTTYHISSQLVIGIFLAVAIFFLVDLGTIMYQNTLPINTIFTTQVSVPDFVQGDNPKILYNRTILKTFTGSFSVELKNVKTNLTECIGSLSSVLYEAGEQIDASKYTLSYYNVTPESCIKTLDAGQYYLTTEYTIRQDGLPPRHLVTRSNIFNVYAPDAVVPDSPLAPTLTNPGT